MKKIETTNIMGTKTFIITSLEKAKDALNGSVGTIIYNKNEVNL